VDELLLLEIRQFHLAPNLLEVDFLLQNRRPLRLRRHRFAFSLLDHLVEHRVLEVVARLRVWYHVKFQVRLRLLVGRLTL